MRPTIYLTAALLAGLTTAAAAQQTKTAAQQSKTGIKLADIAGVWDTKTLMGPKDSIVATTVQTIAADAKGWTMAFPTGTPVAVRLLSSAGDSIVTEAGPFASQVRPGQTVTLLHSVNHYKGNQAWGTSVAKYATGDSLTFKTTATRRH